MIDAYILIVQKNVYTNRYLLDLFNVRLVLIIFIAYLQICLQFTKGCF